MSDYLRVLADIRELLDLSKQRALKLGLLRSEKDHKAESISLDDIDRKIAYLKREIFG